MNFLTVGDLHFKKNNLLDQFRLKAEIFKLIEKYSFDFVVFLGDHLHDNEKVNTVLLTEVVKLFREVSEKCPIIVLIGNHDRVNNSDFLGEVHAFTALHEWKNTYVIDSTRMVNIGELSILCVPYVPNGRFIDAIKTLGDIDTIIKHTDLVLAHQEFYGIKFNGILNSTADKWPLDWPLVISGHIHKNCKIQENIHYPGSPIYFEYGEDDVKGLTVYTYKDKVFTDKQYVLELGKKDVLRFYCIDDLIEYLSSIIDKESEKLLLKCTKLHITDTYEKINQLKNYLKKNSLDIQKLMKQNQVVIQFNIIKSLKEKIVVSKSVNFYSLVHKAISSNKDLLKCLEELR